MPNTKNNVPSSRPRLSYSRVIELISPYNLDQDKYPLFIVGIRGYYLNTFGKEGVNDRGIYDDAIFLMSPEGTVSFNANTDPSLFRKATSTKKGIAVLVPGAYYAHQFSTHGGRSSRYPAICQRLAKVTVLRDGDPDYEDTGMFGINIHKGGYKTTSSEGCQTIYPDQWESFYSLAKDMSVRLYKTNWNKEVIPYILIENEGQL